MRVYLKGYHNKTDGQFKTPYNSVFQLIIAKKVLKRFGPDPNSCKIHHQHNMKMTFSGRLV